jgi:hypothetical protein
MKYQANIRMSEQNGKTAINSQEKRRRSIMNIS